MSFEDNGKAYNPFDAKESDITAPATEREIGGLGIFMVKKSSRVTKRVREFFESHTKRKQ